MAITGGIGTLLGSFVGAAAIIILENAVSAFTARWPTVLGLTFILIMMFRAGRHRRACAHPARAQRTPVCQNNNVSEDRSMDRRQFLKTSGLAVAAGTTGILAAPNIVRAEGASIRIGLMAPLTGVVAAGGREIVDGFTLFWEQRRQSGRRPQGRNPRRGRRV